MTSLLEGISRGVGNPKAFPIAIPQGSTLDSLKIESIGICAGSGGSILDDLDVDMLLTGEMSHHETLKATEQGKVVVALFHSNSERGFLRAVLRGQLEGALKEEWWDGEGHYEDVSVNVSESDRDPYGILLAN